MWYDLTRQVLEHFADVARDVSDRRQAPSVEAWIVARQIVESETKNERKREHYEWQRLIKGEWYRRQLARAAARSAAITSDPVRAQKRREQSTIRRQSPRIAEAARRTCEECGEPIPPPATFGRVRKYCSPKCSHRVASRRWWERRRATHGPETPAT